MLGGVCLPVGIWVFAWTAREEVHWIVPVLAGVPFGAGLVLVFVSPLPPILKPHSILWLLS